MLVFCHPESASSAARWSVTAARGPAWAMARGESNGSLTSSTQPRAKAVAESVAWVRPASSQAVCIACSAVTAELTSPTKLSQPAPKAAVRARLRGPYAEICSAMGSRVLISPSSALRKRIFRVCPSKSTSTVSFARSASTTSM